MVFNNTTRTVIGILFALALILAGLWFFWAVRTILVYLAISIVLSLVGRPMLRLLGKVKLGSRTLPDSVKALISLAVMAGVLVGFVGIFVPVIAEEVRIISSIDPEVVAANLEGPIQEMESLVGQYDLGANPEESNREFLERKLTGLIDLTKLSDVFTQLLGTLGNLSMALFSILFITFFLLKDTHIIRNAIGAITPDRYLEQVNQILAHSRKTLTRYFTGILIQVSIVTTLLSAGLYILGVENALVIGFFGGMMNIIPYVGPLIGGAFGIVISLSTNLDMDFVEGMVPLALGIGAVFLAVQLLDNFILQPIIFSNSVKVHPLEIFLVILMAGNLAGVAGMILAIPIYSFLRIIAREFLSEFKLVRSLTSNLE